MEEEFERQLHLLADIIEDKLNLQLLMEDVEAYLTEIEIGEDDIDE